jgi:hypothetical protein
MKNNLILPHFTSPITNFVIFIIKDYYDNLQINKQDYRKNIYRTDN